MRSSISNIVAEPVTGRRYRQGTYPIKTYPYMSTPKWRAARREIEHKKRNQRVVDEAAFAHWQARTDDAIKHLCRPVPQSILRTGLDVVHEGFFLTECRTCFERTLAGGNALGCDGGCTQDPHCRYGIDVWMHVHDVTVGPNGVETPVSVMYGIAAINGAVKSSLATILTFQLKIKPGVSFGGRTLAYPTYLHTFVRVDGKTIPEIERELCEAVATDTEKKMTIRECRPFWIRMCKIEQ